MHETQAFTFDLQTTFGLIPGTYTLEAVQWVWGDYDSDITTLNRWNLCPRYMTHALTYSSTDNGTDCLTSANIMDYVGNTDNITGVADIVVKEFDYTYDSVTGTITLTGRTTDTTASRDVVMNSFTVYIKRNTPVTRDSNMTPSTLDIVKGDIKRLVNKFKK